MVVGATVAMAVALTLVDGRSCLWQQQLTIYKIQKLVTKTKTLTLRTYAHMYLC